MIAKRLLPAASLATACLLASCQDATSPVTGDSAAGGGAGLEEHRLSAGGAWSAPVQLPSSVNLPDADTRNAFETRDGLSLYFASVPGDGSSGRDIFVSHRRSEWSAWGEAINLGTNINASNVDFHGDNHPNLSPGGHWLFFSSKRENGCGDGDLDLYASYRTNVQDDHGWGQAVNLGCTINSDGDERSPFFFRDPRTGQAQLYFAADHGDGNLDDIYVSTRQRDGTWGPGVRVPSLSTPYEENKISLSPDGLEAYFGSDRPAPGSSSEDKNFNVWVATRRSTSDAWGPAHMIVSGYGLPNISWDGETLYVGGPQIDSPDLAGVFALTRARSHGSERQATNDAIGE